MVNRVFAKQISHVSGEGGTVVSYSNSVLLSEHTSQADATGKEFSIFHVLRDEKGAWLYIILEGTKRPCSSDVAYLKAVSNSVKSLRELLHKRFELLHNYSYGN